MSNKSYTLLLMILLMVVISTLGYYAHVAFISRIVRNVLRAEGLLP